MLQETGVNVEFVLDGSGTPTWGNKCLEDKWRPWVATWNLCSSFSLLFSMPILRHHDVRFVRQPIGAILSNDPSKNYDRFQFFNLPVGSSSVDKVFATYACASPCCPLLLDGDVILPL